MGDKKDRQKRAEITRRRFLQASGTMAAMAGGALAGCGAAQPASTETTQPPAEPKTQEARPAQPLPAQETEAPAEAPRNIARFRTLGRTGFNVGDISMGCGEIGDPNVVRYAYDHGINLFDVAEDYGNGDSERKIGEAMQYMDRGKIFIVTKVKVEPTDKEQVIADRLYKCLERLKTDHVDALYMHSVQKVNQVKHKGFHKAIVRLKSEGKVKHAGLACHGPHGKDGDGMDKVLLAAAEDGRFDVMLFVHNFMKAEEGERVLKACKEKNIGTTCMKAGAGQLKIEPFDPENPSKEYAGFMERMLQRGMTKEQAIERIKGFLASQTEELVKNKPAIDAFMAKHGAKTQDDLDKESVRWVLSNADMHTVCVSMSDFDKLNKFLPLSGTTLTARGEELLRDYSVAFENRYCRHGCKECLSRCPHGVQVSTVMRYTYYFDRQKRQKYAMQKYAALGELNGSLCFDCEAPCLAGCPHGVPVQVGMIKAHEMLTLA